MKKTIAILCALMLAAIACFTPAMAEEANAPMTVYVELFDGDSNIRSAGTLNDEILAIAKIGERLAYLGEYSVDDRGVVWYKVERKEVTGWVSSRYTVLTDAENYVRSFNVETGDLAGDLALNANVSLLAAPTADAEVVCEMAEGETVAYLGYWMAGIEQNWYYVEYAGQFGWVSSLNAAAVVEAETETAAE